MQKKISLHPILITMEEDLGQQEKAQLNTFKEIWKKEINGVTMPSSGEDGIVKKRQSSGGISCKS